MNIFLILSPKYINLKYSDILPLTSQLSILIPIFVGIRYYKSLDVPFKVLFYFFIVSIPFEILAEVTRRVYHNNMPGQHAYTVVEFLALSTIYFLHTRKNSIAKYLIAINAIIFIGIACKNAFYDTDGFMASNDSSRAYSSVFLIVYTLLYLYYLFKKDDIRYLREYPMFWVCIALLIYYGLNVLYFIEKSTLLKMYPHIEWISDLFHALLIIVANCLVAQSFICIRKYKPTSLSFT